MNEEFIKQVFAALGIVLAWYILVRLTSMAVFTSYFEFKQKLHTKFGKGEATDGKK